MAGQETVCLPVTVDAVGNNCVEVRWPQLAAGHELCSRPRWTVVESRFGSLFLSIASQDGCFYWLARRLRLGQPGRGNTDAQPPCGNCLAVRLLWWKKYGEFLLINKSLQPGGACLCR